MGFNEANIVGKGVWAVPRQINVNWGKLRPPAKGEAGNSSLLPDEI